MRLLAFLPGFALVLWVLVKGTNLSFRDKETIH